MNNNKEIAKKELDINDFPPKLRKLGMFIINSGQLMTLKEACGATGINYSTIRTHILRCKKNGKDFHNLIDTHVIEKLRNARPDVYKSLQKGAISGSLGHQKLYSQLVGDYTERQQIDHKVQGKIVLFSPSGIPQDIQEQRAKERDENGVQIIDLDFDD